MVKLFNFGVHKYQFTSSSIISWQKNTLLPKPNSLTVSFQQYHCEFLLGHNCLANIGQAASTAAVANALLGITCEGKRSHVSLNMSYKGET